MATRAKRLIGMIEASKASQPINKQFLKDIMLGIEQVELKSRNQPSVYYKPSGMNCMRMMYYVRTAVKQDDKSRDYQSIGMAQTGTNRHENIQHVLLEMNRVSDKWKYIDVEEYVNNLHEKGIALDLKVKGKEGAETKLLDEALNLSFRCDGILLHIPTNEYYLFEFKNQTSFKYYNKKEVDLEHRNQATAYCTSLHLNKCIFLYENRDLCELECPTILEVTEQNKEDLVHRLLTCEEFVRTLTPPPVEPTSKLCRYCSYVSQCKKDGQ